MNTIGSYQCIASTTQPTSHQRHSDGDDVTDDDNDVDDDNDDVTDDGTLCESGYRFDSSSNTFIDVDECLR